ncbi:MAG TPA: Fur family transcriptional regulator [Thermodesulfovibrionales bacterium]|nr:Fur family transcriptional regulator [Thermodesulfovibrionales bacterium]
MNRHRTPLDIEQKLISSLRDKGYKLTIQRLEIIKCLSRDLSHPGARDILQKVRKNVPRISMSTVYYTLDMMKKEGLLREIDFYDRDNRYDTNILDHINLVCTKCGRITDFMGDMPSFSKAVEKETGFKPASMRFEYYGYCKECRRVRRP